MEFFFAILFLLFYYIRPQDWVTGFEGANVVKPILALWFVVMIAARSRQSPLQGFMRTPHDWIMLAYLGYIVVFADGPIMAVIPYLAFYYLTLQSVNSWPRLLKYLTAWNWALVVVASFGVAFLFGIDITGAGEIRYNQLGRLAIGTWTHDNPNALGHSVVLIIPLSYMLYFWRGSTTGRAVVFPILSVIAFYCAWETQSKGAYVVGGIAFLLVFVIGRSRKVKIFVLAFAFLLGGSALSFLPRMAEMNNLAADQGVQGRLLAWEMARTVTKNNPLGVGWNKFVAYIDWEEGNRTETMAKATHSSYVKVAADLGWVGLFLYLAVLWTAARTLIGHNTTGSLQDRCRRFLIVMFVATVLSGWMINRQYHTEYFLLIAASAAMHRLIKRDEMDRMSARLAGASFPDDEYSSMVSNNGTRQTDSDQSQLVPGDSRGGTLSSEPRQALWNRFGPKDVAICAGLTWLTFWIWDYIAKNI